MMQVLQPVMQTQTRHVLARQVLQHVMQIQTRHVLARQVLQHVMQSKTCSSEAGVVACDVDTDKTCSSEAGVVVCDADTDQTCSSEAGVVACDAEYRRDMFWETGKLLQPAMQMQTGSCSWRQVLQDRKLIQYVYMYVFLLCQQVSFYIIHKVHLGSQRYYLCHIATRDHG